MKADGVGSGRCYVHRVAEPLAAAVPAKIVAAARGRGRFQIDAVATIAVILTIDGSNVIADTLAASIVVFGHYGAGNSRRYAAVRTLHGSCCLPADCRSVSQQSHWSY